MTLLTLTQDTPKQIQLNSTSWHDGKRAVFFCIVEGDSYRGGASFTPDEARQFGQMLIDEAERIEKRGYPPKKEPSP